jgi:hypothetical protein
LVAKSLRMSTDVPKGTGAAKWSGGAFTPLMHGEPGYVVSHGGLVEVVVVVGLIARPTVADEHAVRKPPPTTIAMARRNLTD